ncbi:type IV conjugative transfer system protein TraE [Thiotrichales bacterium 19S11-10]|nr:type IV conjugative transfer system protein TraE [Thiotrichales bacterium 19S11-10]
MKTQLRDDVLTKNRQIIRILITTCLSLVIVVLVLSGLSFYSFFVKERIYIPTHSSESFSLSSFNASPSYLSDMATDIMQSRLTWSSDTISKQYTKLLNLVSVNQKEALKKTLNEEIESVKRRKMSSVFYQNKKPLVDSQSLVVQVTGQLQRVDDGIILKPVKKTYQIHFSYHLGLLTIVSISEVKGHA